MRHPYSVAGLPATAGRGVAPGASWRTGPDPGINRGVRTSVIALTLALTSAAAGCGGHSADSAALDQRQGQCQGLQLGIDTPGSAAQLFGFAPCPVVNDSHFSAIDAGDRCTYDSVQSVRKLYWQWIAADPSLCSSRGGCVYYCELRTMDPAADPGLPGRPICASRFLRGQPGFICP
jgi:hypothetical protein